MRAATGIPAEPVTRRRPASRAWHIGIAACALLAALNLLSGISGGLARLGLPLPASATGVHGAVMVCGFFGTLIALERAVALQRMAGLLAPLAAGTGGLLAWLLHADGAAQAAWLVAGGALVGLYLHAGRTRAWSLHLMVELAAALCWVAGTLAWWAGSLALATIGWLAFLVLTIAGERRELTQMLRLPAVAGALFGVVVALVLLSVLLATASVFGVPNAGRWAALPGWTGFALLALWLLRWDIAPRKWRSPDWIGHTAVCLTVGYGWLLVGALLGLAGLVGPSPATALAQHAVLLGFVFAMVFGHAPIILPALSGIRPVYSAWARWPIGILSASLLWRGAALAGGHSLAGAGLLHALAIFGFAGIMGVAVHRSVRQRGARQGLE